MNTAYCIDLSGAYAANEGNVQVYETNGTAAQQWSVVKKARILMQEAMKNPEITYVHVISGQCYPAENVEKIYDFYENNTNIYMTASPVEGAKKSGEPLIWWQKYYFNYDKINRRTTFGKIYHRLNIAVQTLLHVDKIKKLGIDLELFEGANYHFLRKVDLEHSQLLRKKLNDYYGNTICK